MEKWAYLSEGYEIQFAKFHDVLIKWTSIYMISNAGLIIIDWFLYRYVRKQYWYQLRPEVVIQSQFTNSS